MRSPLARRPAALGCLALLLAACATACSDEESTGSGALLISNGSATVTIDGAQVSFPGPVSDAVWSPDGSRIAYVDGDGNIATAEPDGSDVVVLTRTDPSVVRSRPTWNGAWLLFAEKRGDSSTLISIPTNGCDTLYVPSTGSEWYYGELDQGSLNPSAPNATPAFIAFQHDGDTGPEIYIHDPNQRQPETTLLAEGSEPALSPDGTAVAFVGTNGEIFVATETPGGYVAQWSAPTQITSGAHSPTHLAWSADGIRLVYRTPSAVEWVSATPSGGQNAPTKITDGPGVPSVLWGAPNNVNMLVGGDATALSIAVSQARFPTSPAYLPSEGYRGANSATVVSPDAVATAPTHGGPLLVTDAGFLDSRVREELRRIFGETGEYGVPWVYVSGVSSTVRAELADMGFLVDPAGDSQQRQTSDDPCRDQASGYLTDGVVLVDGADPLALGLASSMAGLGPLLVVSDGALSEAQVSYLSHSAGSVDTVYVVGTLPSAVADRVGELVSSSAGFRRQTNPTRTPLPSVSF